MITVPRRWPGATVACIASGPSLTAEDVAAVRAAGLPMIVVNDAVKLAPFADVLYSSDQYWYPRHDGVPSFTGQKYAVRETPMRQDHAFAKWPEIQVLRNTGQEGLELDPTGLRTGKNSGYAAINLAVHFGSTRILLLGYDMSVGKNGASHFDGSRQSLSNYQFFRTYYTTIVEPLQAAGVEVLNCTRRTMLKAFPLVSLEDALCQVAA